jgi:hypothetical protein
MKQASILQIVKDRGHGKLRAIITVCPNGDGKLFYMAIVYGPGDDGTSGWYFKKRSMSALLKIMEKKLTAYNKPMRAMPKRTAAIG